MEKNMLQKANTWVSVQGTSEGDQSLDQKKGQGIGGHPEL